MNAIQLFLPKTKKPKKNVPIQKIRSISPTDFRLKEQMMNTPLNQLLDTVLVLMNEIPVEEEVSYRTIHQLRRRYVNLQDREFTII